MLECCWCQEHQMALVLASGTALRCQDSTDCHILPLRQHLWAESIFMLSLSTQGDLWTAKSVTGCAGSMLQQLANSRKDVVLKKQE